MTPAEFEQITYTVFENVATITLNRPRRRNAWTGQMATEYRWALHTAEHDPDAGAIVITGAGDFFSVGADRDILAGVSATGTYTRQAADLPPYPDDAPPALRHNHTYPLALSKPTIAALNGPCAGAGFVLACFTDFRITVADNKITPSFAALGLPAEYGLAWTLTRIVGQQNALEILLANPVMTGDQAKELGFARSSVPAPHFPLHVHHFARNLARHSSPASLKTIKRQLWQDAWTDLETAYTRAVTDMNHMITQPDFTTALTATRHHQKPTYLPRKNDNT